MFSQVVRNLSRGQLDQLNRDIEDLPKGSSKLVVQSIAEGRIDFLLFRKKDFPMRSLRAFKKGKIDANEFATSQLFANVLRQNNEEKVKEIPLFCEGCPNREAVRFIAGSADSDRLGSRPGALHGKDMEQFFKAMEDLKPFEQRFLILAEDSSKNNSMGKELDRRGSFFLRSKENIRMIVSLGILQRALQILYGEKAVTIMPRFSLSSRELIQEEMLLNQRSFCLNFSAFPVENAHGVFCDPRYNDLEMHDWYHLQLVSSVPKEDKKKFCALSRACCKISRERQYEKFYLELADQFADLENYAYFIISGEKAFQAAVFHILLSTVKSEYCTKENVMRFVAILNESIRKGDLRKLADELKLASEYYEAEYGLKSGELKFLKD